MARSTRGQPDQSMGTFLTIIHHYTEPDNWYNSLFKKKTLKKFNIANEGPYSQSYGFFSSHVQMWKLYIQKAESWRIDASVVLQKTLESPLGNKEIKPVNPKGNQPWVFIGRTDAEAEAEASICWPPGVNSQLTGKDHDTGKDWDQEEKRTTEDEVVGWHQWLNGHEFEQALR